MNVSWPLFLLGIGVLLSAFVLVFLQPAERSRTKANAPVVFRNDDWYWTGGFLYNNPDDPAVIVPKRYGIGWTVNIGQPIGKLIMYALLLLPLVLILAKALSRD